MPNFDGVYELRFQYSTTPASEEALIHQMTLDVILDGDPSPGDPFDSIDALLHNGSPVGLETYILDTLMPLIVPAFPVSSEWITAELWKIPEGTFNATFISVLEIGEVGSNGTGSSVAQQTTFTFRTQGGNGGRLQLMESSFSGNTRQTPPFASATANNLTAHLVSLATPIVGRDNTRFVARVAQNDGQNEILWRKRFRN